MLLCPRLRKWPLPPMPIVGEEAGFGGKQLAAADAPMRPPHEIEYWTGGKKSLIVVPEN